MAGYNGYSMSKNAVYAYATGEKPFTKWTKSDLIEEIENMIECQELDTKLTLDEFAKLPTYVLKTLLSWSSWHHTSSKFNKTDFFSVSEDSVINLDKEAVERLMLFHTEQLKQKKSKTDNSFYFAEVVFGVWGGTIKRPTLTDVYSDALIVGNWAYLLNDFTISKKRIDGKHFSIIKKYGTRKPKGFNADLVKKAKSIALKKGN